jgi:hypothetical protein
VTVVWGVFYAFRRAFRRSPYDLQGVFATQDEATGVVREWLSAKGYTEVVPGCYWLHPEGHTWRVSSVEIGRLRDSRDNTPSEILATLRQWFEQHQHIDTGMVFDHGDSHVSQEAT